MSQIDNFNIECKQCRSQMVRISIEKDYNQEEKLFIKCEACKKKECLEISYLRR